MAIAIECPVCEFQGKVADDQQGKETVCKGCGHKWTVSAAEARTSSGAATATATAANTVTATTKPATAELISAQCPACKTKGKVPASARGKKVKCPKCAESFVVGQIVQPAAQPSGPAAKLQDADEPPPVDEPTVYTPPPSKALDEVKAPDDVGITPLEGAEIVEDEEKGEVYDLVGDDAIVVDTLCPGCKHKGTVPEKFKGKKVKCPRCSAMFVVGGSPPPSLAPVKSDAVAADNPFAVLDAGATTKIKPAPAAPAVADDNPFAFDDSAPSKPAPAKPAAPARSPAKVEEAPRPAPKSKAGKSKVEPKFDEEEARTNAYMMAAAGGFVLLAVIIGGFFVIRILNAPAAKDTNFAVVTPTEREEPRDTPKPSPKARPSEPDAKAKLPDELVARPDPKPEPKVQDPTPEPNPQPIRQAKEPTWVDASRESAQLGDLRVRVTAAWIDFPKGPGGVSPRKFLMLQVQIENQSADKQAAYVGWSVANVIAGKNAPARLIDPVGKELKLATQKETVIKPAGQLTREFIMPGQTLDDLLVFEPPAGKTPEYMRLELPAENLGGQGSLGFQLPDNYVAGSATTKDPLVKVGTDPAQPPDKALAEKLALLRQTAKKGLPAQRENAIKTLGELGVNAGPAVPDLMGYLREDKNEMVRAASAEALGKIGPPAKIAINALIAALRDEFWRVKANACESLAVFGPDAKDAIPYLKKLMQSKEEEVPTKAALALSKIDQQTRGGRQPPPKGVPPPKGAPPPPPKGVPPPPPPALKVQVN